MDHHRWGADHPGLNPFWDDMRANWTRHPRSAHYVKKIIRSEGVRKILFDFFLILIILI